MRAAGDSIGVLQSQCDCAGSAQAVHRQRLDESVAVAAALIAGAASAAGPLILKAIENDAPEVVAALEKLPVGMVPVAPATPAITVETSVAKNLVADVPAAGASEYTKIKAQIGEAIAIYVTEHGADDLATGGLNQAAWVDILSRASAAITQEGIVVSAIKPSTIWQMVLSGIEMYRAGLGARALTVEK
jgi:ammonia channel protein AmtB